MMLRESYRRLAPRLFAPVFHAYQETSDALASRWELARLEWAVERNRLVQSLVGLAILGMGGLLVLVFAGFAVIVTWWDTEHRILVAWLVCAVFAFIALVGLFMWRFAAMRKDKRFAGLSAELASDRNWIAQQLRQTGRPHA